MTASNWQTAHTSDFVVGIPLVLVLALPMLAACDRTDALVEASKVAAPQAGSLVSVERPARQIVSDCLRAYRVADHYSDAATVRLLYTLDGRLVEDRAPLKVAFDRKQGLGLDVYSVRAGMNPDFAGQACLQASIEGSNEIQNQIMCQAVPETLSAAWLQKDPILSEHLAAGLAGFPVQLDLLLGSESLESVFSERSRFSLHRTQEVDARKCAVIAVETPAGLQFHLWIDLEDSTLRRIEYPAEALPARMTSDDRVTEIQLTVEFSNASFAAAPDIAASLPVASPNDRYVEHFVSRPPQINDPLLGEAVAAFDLLSPKGGIVQQTSQIRRDGKNLVMIWLANHPASKAAALQLHEIENAIQESSPKAAKKIQFVSIWAEPDTPGGQSFDRLQAAWQMPGMLAVDQQAMGRDVFGISEAPTLIVLDSLGRVQLRTARADPNLSSTLPPLLFALAEGRNIAGESIKAAQIAQKQFVEQLEAATIPFP